jgi:hypothetical protein
MSKEDLVKEAFKYINSFKRFRALESIEKEKGNYAEANHTKLKQYEMIDKLELSLRAIQKDLRGSDSNNE